uniref:Uncharacterized protein n=1 Tax=Arundo donax TaxID=35708 RepID=A0A0A9A548_ARUDO
MSSSTLAIRPNLSSGIRPHKFLETSCHAPSLSNPGATSASNLASL